MNRRAWMFLGAAALTVIACVRGLDGAYCDADDTCGPQGSGYVCELPGRLCVTACPATHERCGELRCVPTGTCSTASDAGDSGVNDSGVFDAGGGGGGGGGAGGGGGTADAGLGCALAPAPVIITPRSTFLPKTATSFDLRFQTTAPSGCEVELVQGTQCANETDGGWACASLTGATTKARYPVTQNPVTNVGFTQSPGVRFLQLQVCEPNDPTGCGAPSAIRVIQVGRTLGDLDGDGRADLLLGTTSSNPQLVQYLSTSSMTPQSYPVGAIGLATNVSGIGDYDRDGFSDVVVVGSSSTSTRRPVVLKGSTSGLFSSHQESQGGTLQSGWGVGDINGDGFMDIALLDPANTVATLRLSLGPGAIAVDFTSTAGFSPSYATGVGDLNADGIDDFAVMGNGAGTSQILVFAGRASFGRTGSAVSDTAVTLNVPGVLGPVTFDGIAGVGDFDGDGFSDFVVGHTGNGVSGPIVYRGSSQLVAPANLSDQLGPMSVSPVGRMGVGSAFVFYDPNADVMAGCTQTSSTTSACSTAPATAGNETVWGGVGDLDGDGFRDFVVTYEAQTPAWRAFGTPDGGALSLEMSSSAGVAATGLGHLLATFPAP